MTNKKPIKDQHNPNTESGKIDITQKKFRLSDFLAEKVIKGVAFLSIAIIVLIFVFVFRESLPIFQSEKNSVSQITAKEEVQETYGDVTDKAPVTTDVRGTSVAVKDTAEIQEQYGAVKDSSAIQEQYGVQTNDSLSGKPEDENYTVSSGSGYDHNSAALRTLGTTEWVPVSEKPRYGILALLLGTLKITLISMLFAAPLAILAALYTSVFANKKMKEIIKPTIELLAGFPSVVIGFFALMVLATFLQSIFHYDTRLNSFVGGIAMGIAAIPIIFTITEDALTAVPKTYYEASLALGASRWQTAFFVILPAATPGIFAAILLGIGRVFGETMIALMATGNAAQMDINPFESVRTLAATIGAEMAEVVFGDTHYNVLFLIGSLLFIFTFLLNAIAEFYVKGKLLKRIQGK
ncbi:MAG: phosphate ABC transporter permease subunit PstC [Prolixibacteraceae bacterium]|jgi:phosphate transport system permease protein|nr:phosphate ABC transporter permease subunit PstC [Prolixibacteraceae bacterium]